MIGHGGRKFGTVRFQPSQIGDAVLAKLKQGLIGDHAIDFVLQVGRHGFRRVLEASLNLIGCAATGIHNAARQSAGTPAFKAVNHNDRRTFGPCF